MHANANDSHHSSQIITLLCLSNSNLESIFNNCIFLQIVYHFIHSNKKLSVTAALNIKCSGTTVSDLMRFLETNNFKSVIFRIQVYLSNKIFPRHPLDGTFLNTVTKYYLEKAMVKNKSYIPHIE